MISCFVLSTLDKWFHVIFTKARSRHCYPHHRWGNGSLDKLSGLFRVTQLVSVVPGFEHGSLGLKDILGSQGFCSIYVWHRDILVMWPVLDLPNAQMRKGREFQWRGGGAFSPWQGPQACSPPSPPTGVQLTSSLGQAQNWCLAGGSRVLPAAAHGKHI